MTLLKSIIRKNETLFAILAVLAIIAICSVLFPLLIQLVCKGLLFMMTKPLTGLIITLAFLSGMFFNDIATRIDKK